MDRKIALKWAKALESGEYTQRAGSLRIGDSFCCLGVLCNLHAQAHPEIAAEQEEKEYYCGADDLLPREVMKWAGMGTHDGSFPRELQVKYDIDPEDKDDYETAQSLIQLNDAAEWDFKQIAKFVRKHSDEL